MKQRDNKIPKGLLLVRLGDILHDSDGLLSLVKLNLLFIFSSAIILPPVTVVTVGPSLTALTYCTNQLVIKGYVADIASTYFSIFKKSLKKTIPAGAVMVLATVLFMLGLNLYLGMASESIVYIPFASASLLALLFIWSITLHLFPLLSNDESKDKTMKELASLAFVITIENMVKTLIAVIVSVVFISLIVWFLPASFPLLLTIAFSVPALCAAFAHSVPDIPEL